MAQSSKDQPAPSATAKAIVARGRSIDVPDETKKETIGFREDGAPVTRVRQRTFSVGQEVELPIDEIVTLSRLGYLVDPDNIPPPVEDLASALELRAGGK